MEAVREDGACETREERRDAEGEGPEPTWLGRYNVVDRRTRQGENVGARNVSRNAEGERERERRGTRCGHMTPTGTSIEPDEHLPNRDSPIADAVAARCR